MTTRSLPSRLLLPICRSTCSGIWTSASIRGLHPLVHRRTLCGFAQQTPERVARTSVGATFRATSASATESPRACNAAPTSTLTRAAGTRTAQRSLSTRTSGTSRRRTELVSWFEKKALAGAYHFDPVTEHISSETRLILCSDKGKGQRVLPSLARLAVRCLPTPASRRAACRG